MEKRLEIIEKLKQNHILSILDDYTTPEDLLFLLEILIEEKDFSSLEYVLRRLPMEDKYDIVKLNVLKEYAPELTTHDIASTSDEFLVRSIANIQFMLPQDLIDYTRYSHNELVMERKELRENLQEEFTNLQPSYVVLDDTANMTQYTNSLKAAYELNLPIVYIDTKGIVKRESKAVKALAERAIAKKDISLFKKMLVRRENNVYSYSKEHPKYIEQYFPLDEIDFYFEVFLEQLCLEKLFVILIEEKNKRIWLEVSQQFDLTSAIEKVNLCIQKINAEGQKKRKSM